MSGSSRFDQVKASGGVIRQQPAGELVDDGLKWYAEWLTDVKARVRATQFRAMRIANSEVMKLYWGIGHDILVRQKRDGWGAKVVDRISRDLQREFPGQSGWSRSNLLYMRRIAEVWPTEEEFVPQAVGQIGWGHVRALLDRLETREDRDWYAERAAAEGWSRGVFGRFIKVRLKDQSGAAPTNYDVVFDDPDSVSAEVLLRTSFCWKKTVLDA